MLIVGVKQGLGNGEVPCWHIRDIPYRSGLGAVMPKGRGYRARPWLFEA